MKFAQRIGIIFVKAGAVLIVAGVIVALALALLPDAYLELSWRQRFRTNLSTLFTFKYGASQLNPGYTVGQILWDGGLKSAWLILGAIVLALILGGAAGIRSSQYPHHRGWSALVSAFNILSAVPILVWGFLILLIVIRLLGVLPTYVEPEDQEHLPRYQVLLIYLTPIAAIAFGDSLLSDITRTIKKETTRILEQEYIKALRARNVGLMRYLAQSLVGPIAAIISTKITYLIGGTIVAEYIFSWQALGYWILEAVMVTGNKDYPLVLAATMFFVAIVVVLNLISDLATLLANPNLRGEM